MFTRGIPVDTSQPFEIFWTYSREDNDQTLESHKDFQKPRQKFQGFTEMLSIARAPAFYSKSIYDNTTGFSNRLAPTEQCREVPYDSKQRVDFARFVFRLNVIPHIDAKLNVPHNHGRGNIDTKLWSPQ